MFCEKCGTKLPDNAAFCTNCGASISNAGKDVVEEKVPDTEVKLRVKPTFKLGYVLLPSIIIWLIIILMFSLSYISYGIGASMIVFIVSFIIIASILAIITAIRKKQYDNYCYDFYKTKVVYKDSFLNVSEKEVKYKYIREVTMRQTFIQRYFNIGNIMLFTNAETGYGNGIIITSVENVNDVYKEIKSIIDA